MVFSYIESELNTHGDEPGVGWSTGIEFSHRVDDLADLDATIGCRWQPDTVKTAVAIDHGVGTELARVLGGAAQSPSTANQLRVHRERPRRPHPPERPSPCSEHPVDHPVDIGQHRKVEPEMGSIRRETRRGVGKGDHNRKSMSEFAAVITHGDHVLLAGQSSEMAVQDEHQRTAAMITQAERQAVVIDEDDLWEHIALTDRLVFGHVRSRSASSIPRWNVG
jgi:hypothetical protein